MPKTHHLLGVGRGQCSHPPPPRKGSDATLSSASFLLHPLNLGKPGSNLHRISGRERGENLIPLYYMERDQCRKDRLFPQVQKLEGRSRKLKGKKFLCKSRYRPSPKKKKKVCNFIKSSMSAGTASHFSFYDLHLCIYWAPAVCQAHCRILSRVLIYPPNWAGEQIVGN